ncbi:MULTISPECIES: Dps family protein [Thiomicrospira]|uniref:Ferritin n=1 Tax=Thiomicrospira aerophila AL3 TaxID=717772 RepID=W0DXU5_9GAMM|nr:MULTISPECIES: Dps family protein [Thiomicrospira]AHF01804.1 ferritin [Thiomicrospira aerophila AL3]SFR60931.1 starvation-inducible DNA-binding protein [Thiomicrospira sp. ALE5]
MEINIGIDETTRKDIAAGLSRLLADSYVLFLKTHNYHWNVTGPMFNSLHMMFEQQYTELFTAVDEIAERIRSLGEFAPGSFQRFNQLSQIQEEQDTPDADTMIRNLIAGQEAVVKTAREVVKIADAANDEPTLDLLTQRMQVHEKTAWMLRSLIAK